VATTSAHSRPYDTCSTATPGVTRNEDAAGLTIDCIGE